jgi:hypothetical protein
MNTECRAVIWFSGKDLIVTQWDDLAKYTLIAEQLSDLLYESVLVGQWSDFTKKSRVRVGDVFHEMIPECDAVTGFLK